MVCWVGWCSFGGGAGVNTIKKAWADIFPCDGKISPFKNGRNYFCEQGYMSSVLEFFVGFFVGALIEYIAIGVYKKIDPQKQSCGPKSVCNFSHFSTF